MNIERDNDQTERGRWWTNWDSKTMNRLREIYNE